MALPVFAAGCCPGGESKGTATAASAPQAVAPKPAARHKAPKDGTGATATNRKWDRVWRARADGFVADPVELAGLVYKDTGKALLVYGNLVRKRQLTEVQGPYPGIRKHDYVLVKGVISGAGTYDTADRSPVDVVAIDGVSVSRIDRDRALELAGSAGKGMRKLGLGRTRGGLRVTLESIEWSKAGTRLEVSVRNRGPRKAGIDASDVLIQQGPRRHHLSQADKGADGLSGRIRPGHTKRATLTFARISRKRGKAYIAFTSRSGNRRNADKPFAFTMRWKP
jgi:hypothetical protein